MKKQSTAYINIFNASIKKLFRDAHGLSLKNPASAYSFSKSILYLKSAEIRRKKWEKEGLHVPPLMISSVTKRCNLACKGCYAKEQEKKNCDIQTCNNGVSRELDTDHLKDVFRQAYELGVSIILLAGGEPLIRPDILGIAASYPKIIFPLFTNGLLLDEEKINILKNKRNIIPIVSMEGNCKETNNRRGTGVYEHIMPVLEMLKKNDIFYGISLTATSSNFTTITSELFIKHMLQTGSKLFIFVEYVPVDEETASLALTSEQKIALINIMNDLQTNHPGLFIAFPGDEEIYGGCLAAGRGFVHISASGNVEPCPFAPYSDVNLANCSLKEALQSPFLEQIRSNHGELTETTGGCALWQKREWVQSLLSKKDF